MPGSRWRERLSYLNWLYNPFHGLDTRSIYDLLATHSPTEDALYLNLGYWREASTFDQACDALAMLVGETAQINNRDTVLDCGFGFGDQDILWSRKLNPKRIIGLNITSSQVAVARRRIVDMALDERIDLCHGSATEMPIESDSVDKVVAVECAFHFCTREAFFREAHRVLRRGGLLVTADIIPMPALNGFARRLNQRMSWGLAAGKFAIPADNAYTRPTYRAKLATSGFERIRVESIRDRVYAPMHRYLAEHPETLRRFPSTVRPPVRLALRAKASSVYCGLDYVLASASKPSGSPL